MRDCSPCHRPSQEPSGAAGNQICKSPSSGDRTFEKQHPRRRGSIAVKRGRMVALVILVFAATGAKCAEPSQSTRPEALLRQASYRPKIGSRLPTPLVFTNHAGRPVDLTEVVRQRPTVICLVYFDCPMLCKLAADGLYRAVASMEPSVGSDFNIAVISFNTKDTPQDARHARAHALQQVPGGEGDSSGEGWYFLTGDRPTVDRLTDALGFRYVWDERSKQFAHASGLVVVAADGTMTEFLDGVQFSPQQLSQAIDRSRRGEVSDREPPATFVRCYLYDPTTGKFGALVQWSLRLLGVSTVIGLGVMIFRLARQRRFA
ncbi:SCO family protein [Roseiconus nitratireducens]|uniref:SCO family protein n=1 Tax=Roseiconus nitratireducens TaxID=2605748 RepID=A0A5M6D2W3_9BACT|nr:SCO family protein [Roseiconus nitratireducens]KAA5541811.1 SCO family protein [Roseiconus nitratireducens]